MTNLLFGLLYELVVSIVIHHLSKLKMYRYIKNYVIIGSKYIINKPRHILFVGCPVFCCKRHSI